MLAIEDDTQVSVQQPLGPDRSRFRCYQILGIAGKEDQQQSVAALFTAFQTQYRSLLSIADDREKFSRKMISLQTALAEALDYIPYPTLFGSTDAYFEREQINRIVDRLRKQVTNPTFIEKWEDCWDYLKLAYLRCIEDARKEAVEICEAWPRLVEAAITPQSQNWTPKRRKQKAQREAKLAVWKLAQQSPGIKAQSRSALRVECIKRDYEQLRANMAENGLFDQSTRAARKLFLPSPAPAAAAGPDLASDFTPDATNPSKPSAGLLTMRDWIKTACGLLIRQESEGLVDHLPIKDLLLPLLEQTWAHVLQDFAAILDDLMSVDNDPPDICNRLIQPLCKLEELFTQGASREILDTLKTSADDKAYAKLFHQAWEAARLLEQWDAGLLQYAQDRDIAQYTANIGLVSGGVAAIPQALLSDEKKIAIQEYFSQQLVACPAVATIEIEASGSGLADSSVAASASAAAAHAQSSIMSGDPESPAGSPAALQNSGVSSGATDSPIASSAVPSSVQNVSFDGDMSTPKQPASSSFSPRQKRPVTPRRLFPEVEDNMLQPQIPAVSESAEVLTPRSPAPLEQAAASAVSLSDHPTGSVVDVPAAGSDKPAYALFQPNPEDAMMFDMEVDGEAAAAKEMPSSPPPANVPGHSPDLQAAGAFPDDDDSLLASMDMSARRRLSKRMVPTMPSPAPLQTDDALRMEARLKQYERQLEIEKYALQIKLYEKRIKRFKCTAYLPRKKEESVAALPVFNSLFSQVESIFVEGFFNPNLALIDNYHKESEKLSSKQEMKSAEVDAQEKARSATTNHEHENEPLLAQDKKLVEQNKKLVGQKKDFLKTQRYLFEFDEIKQKALRLTCLKKYWQTLSHAYCVYFMSSLPEGAELRKYANSYILINSKHLYYVQDDYTAVDVRITDFDLFTRKLAAIKPSVCDEMLPLTEEVIKNLITSNGGHKPCPPPNISTLTTGMLIEAGQAVIQKTVAEPFNAATQERENHSLLCEHERGFSKGLDEFMEKTIERIQRNIKLFAILSPLVCVAASICAVPLLVAAVPAAWSKIRYGTGHFWKPLSEKIRIKQSRLCDEWGTGAPTVAPTA